MKYAEVAVNAPGSYRHSFTYSIPENLEVIPGQAVWVPFGSRVLKGIILDLTDFSPIEDTRDIKDVISPFPLLSQERIKLTKWISRYYMAPLFESVALMLPPGFEQNDAIKPKYARYFALNISVEEAERWISQLREKRALKQADLIEMLLAAREPLPSSDICGKYKFDYSIIKALISKGLIAEQTKLLRRDPLMKCDFPLELPVKFTEDQEAAWKIIHTSSSSKAENGNGNIFLLHGVTGSGKTEIYLHALEETLKKGKKGICLVPEISLTPQMIERFFSRFPGRVAVLHSRLTRGEQYDEWYRIYNGDADVVIGARSAIFAPQPELGLIIIDEEHEWSYKQTDKSPRYHTREVAVELARLTGAILILGSATPDIVTYYRALNDEYRLIELKGRATPLGAESQPEVTVINMGDEYKAGNHSIFSRLLKKEMEDSLKAHQQVVLFVNRRGVATFIRCDNCGYVAMCKRCTGSLTYHASSKKLVCHHCRKSYPFLKKCPICLSEELKYLGIGTEAVEHECRRFFPSVTIIRLDSDAVAHPRDYEAILKSFRTKSVDIIIGTQLVAKGLDFPGVSLVGVISADVNINLPDFRAGERTFQLLCQVAGRAGRGIVAGKAIIQTFNPEYYAVKFAANHDYKGFYDEEIRYRKYFGYPPFNKMIRLIYTSSNEERCLAETQKVASAIKKVLDSIGDVSTRIIGPAPAFVYRLRGKYQMQLILLGRDIQTLFDGINLSRGWIIDVDPVGIV